MTASLLFSQAISQTHSPGIERGKMGVSVQDLSAVTNTPDESAEKDGESFLNTLKQIAKDFNSTQQLLGAGEVKSSETHTFDSADNLDAIAHPADALETGVSETTTPSVNDMDDAAVQEPHALNFLEIINTLEELGILDSMGGSSSPNKAAEILGDEEGIVTLKMLIPRLGQNDFVPSAEMKAALDRLQQFISNVQTGKALSHNNCNPLDELTNSRTTESANLNQPVENSQAVSRSENGEKTDPIKLAMAARLDGVESSENAKEPRTLETDRTDASGLKDGSDTPGKTGASSQADFLNRISSTVDDRKQIGGESAQQKLPHNDSSFVSKITNDAQAAKASDPESRYGSEPVQNIAVNNESSTVSKMIHDSQLAKENHLRMDAAMNDELGGKVTKVDAGAGDNGQLSSQNQTAEKAFEATSPSKQPDTAQDSLRTQTLDQIVRKAVLYMRNGQHEAKIDLKPEFLGHVRMQVTTADHQVTVKILTEFGFVKDMVENNIHQLKADLQQQGLNVDKLEVALSNDSDEDKQLQEKAGPAKDRQRRVARNRPGNREGESPEQAGDFGLRRAGTATVDYFA
jgi:flagellar hook-length control protein FliK